MCHFINARQYPRTVFIAASNLSPAGSPRKGGDTNDRNEPGYNNLKV